MITIQDSEFWYHIKLKNCTAEVLDKSLSYQDFISQQILFNIVDLIIRDNRQAKLRMKIWQKPTIYPVY